MTLIKRSVTLRGHRTSLALEPEFWAAAEQAAAAAGEPLAQLIARVDDARAGTGQALSSALRVHLLRLAQRR